MFDDLNLLELTDTIIHEYIHHLQFQKKSTEKDYNKKFTEIGYWNNPYEVNARKLAKQNRNDCLRWVMDQLFEGFKIMLEINEMSKLSQIKFDIPGSLNSKGEKIIMHAKTSSIILSIENFLIKLLSYFNPRNIINRTAKWREIILN